MHGAQDAVRTFEQHSIVTVYFCPENEPANAAMAERRFWVTPLTSFVELHEHACQLYSQPFVRTRLKDDIGSTWPSQTRVATELQKFDNCSIRLCPCEDKDKDEEDEEKFDGSDLDSDDTPNNRLGRKTHMRAFILHAFYLFLLFYRVVGFNDDGEHKMKQSLKVAFTHPDPSGGFIAFDDIRSAGHMCQWLTGTFELGLFSNSQNYVNLEVDGSILKHNRLVGGIHFKTETESIPDDCHGASVDSGCTPRDFQRLERESTTTKILTILSPRKYPSGWMENQSVVMNSDYRSFTHALCEGDYSSSQGSPVATFDEPTQYVEEHDMYFGLPMNNHTEVLRSLRITFMMYNHNANLYAFVDFAFEATPAGGLEPRQQIGFFKVDGLITTWSTYIGIPELFFDFRLYVFVAYYTLVFSRIANEFNDARSILKASGSLSSYFSNAVAVCEVAALSVNVVEIIVEIYFSVLATAFLFPPLYVQEGDPRNIVFLYQAARVINSTLVITTSLLTGTFLTLTPKLSYIYLNGSAVSKAARPLAVNTIVIMGVAVSMAVVGECLLGTQVDEFSSIFRSISSVVGMFTGGVEFTFKPIDQKLKGGQAIAARIFFFGIYLFKMIFASRFFLAIINHTYATQFLMMLEGRQRLQERYRSVMQNTGRSRSREILIST
mmetsp:Transcript_54769/g.108736  ORF Transcript_54769/g.108736 Transcript_54769/m.108736 type:complete len:664 (-) Transcript_54769:153-2144(-)|eukprot:CAMPEP_0174728396 /NCGR_PEP_ID=MMETSP1094-20130205/51656_1 /TAXON_ID=156173 /ORGANISM="Chrysochromulina brevifilum, Strain UTEX LB 985" /LENGTH=663 /DNA_ID=CAMNT_0015930301 /DNA_START=90 /DNA_END=2081 /DNA_ORIENTATION=-